MIRLRASVAMVVDSLGFFCALLVLAALDRQALVRGAFEC